ncbi:hypothetical protein ABGB12_11435 [Actinocorallia sp. B10E7]|uniref:hypothetical protein n=1 Tax=Actinocorallia sp. B10E7 TaxID=3153558 RepID=UPI00325DE17B
MASQDSSAGGWGCAGILLLVALGFGLFGFSEIRSGGSCAGKTMTADDTCSTTVNGEITTRNAGEQASENRRMGWIMLGIGGVAGVACVLLVSSVWSDRR